MSSQTCDYFPNCEICPNCNECHFKKPISNSDVLPLLKLELEYRQKHNKEIDLNKILNWYNIHYGVNIPFSTIKYISLQVLNTQ